MPCYLQRTCRLSWAMFCAMAFCFLPGTAHPAIGLDPQGQVWQWAAKAEPTVITGLPAIKQLAIGQGFTLALDQQGQIWVWGRNNAGQLGLNHFRSVDKPTPLLLPEKIVAVAAGSQHALAIDTQGQIWSWGSNSQGQLGEGLASPFEMVRQPRRIQPGFLARDIAAGNDFSAALDRDGNLWLWGKTPAGKMSQPQRQKVPSDGKVIAASGSMMALSDTHGDTWAWAPLAQPAKTGRVPEWLAHAGRGDAIPALKPPAKPAVVAPPATPPVAAAPQAQKISKPEPAKGSAPFKPTPTLNAAEATKPISSKSAEPARKTAYKLVGRIRSGGIDPGGVRIRGNGVTCSDSDESGRFICQAPAGWTGTLTPSKPGYRFSPSSVTVPAVQEDDPDVQTFRAIYEPQ